MNKEFWNAAKSKVAAFSDCLMVLNIAVNSYVLYRTIKQMIKKHEAETLAQIFAEIWRKKSQIANITLFASFKKSVTVTPNALCTSELGVTLVILLVIDGVGGEDAGTASLAATLGGDGHTNLAYVE